MLGLHRAALNILSVHCNLILEAVTRGCKSGDLSPRLFAHSIKISLKRHLAPVVASHSALVECAAISKHA